MNNDSSLTKKFVISIFFTLLAISAYTQAFDSLYTVNTHEIYFKSGKYILEEASINHLDSILSIDSTYIYELEGHTDLVGSEKSNQLLSENRVETIRFYLVSRDIKLSNIMTIALGESKPKVNSEIEVLENRRVTIAVLKKKTLRWISGNIVDDSTNIGIEALVKFEGKNFSDSIYSDDEGKFKVALPDKANYKMSVLASGYFFDERFIKVAKLAPFVFAVQMPEAKVGKTFEIPLIFRGSAAILVLRSVPTIGLLYDFLINSKVCIEIKGHVNRPEEGRSLVGSGDHTLSVNRAHMVMKSMINKGIEPIRMAANGYGNWEMLFPNGSTEAHYSKNRRVEVVVIECKDVTKLRK
ncbi:MAG: outer membrane protein OmpA-like peptidoglycan-associated protein [Saprospiraceae bacterium]|jgi:outer membrane protein OmpA-like peptidoglycan-associated protein